MSIALQSLKQGLDRGADSAAGWLAYVELLYQERRYSDAYEMGCKG